MRQTAEVYDIQIDSNLKWLWPFRLINSFPVYQYFLLNYSLSKLSSLIKAWTCSIFPTFSGIIESPPKSLSISRILTLFVFALRKKNPVRNITFNNNQVTSDPDVSIQTSWSCADSPFCIHLLDMLSQVTLLVFLTKGYCHSLRKGLSGQRIVTHSPHRVLY